MHQLPTAWAQSRNAACVQPGMQQLAVLRPLGSDPASKGTARRAVYQCAHTHTHTRVRCASVCTHTVTHSCTHMRAMYQCVHTHTENVMQTVYTLHPLGPLSVCLRVMGDWSFLADRLSQAWAGKVTSGGWLLPLIQAWGCGG